MLPNLDCEACSIQVAQVVAAFAYLQCGDITIRKNPALPTTVYNVSVPIPTTGFLATSLETTRQELPSEGVRLGVWALGVLLAFQNMW